MIIPDSLSPTFNLVSAAIKLYHVLRLILVWGLRFSAVAGCLAVVPALLPFAYLAKGAELVGLELTKTPLSSYLARHLSLGYAFVSALLLVVSFDIDRYRNLLMWSVPLLIVWGVLQLAVNWQVGMPFWWVVIEGPRTILAGIALGLLMRLGRV